MKCRDCGHVHHCVGKGREKHIAELADLVRGLAYVNDVEAQKTKIRAKQRQLMVRPID